MNQRDNQRAHELSNLKLALATFAVRLDTFEARMKRRQTITKPGRPEIGAAFPFPAPGERARVTGPCTPDPSLLKINALIAKTSAQ
jgi:hypothetical protein